MLTVFLITILAVVFSIGIHYSVLLFTTFILAHFHGRHPASIILSLFLAVIAHLSEILVFAVAWQELFSRGLIEFYLPSSGSGTELIEFSLSMPRFIDMIYFSGTTYTTIGYGDIIILGEGRIVAVVEGVMGLVLIAWTASFTYFEMNRKWVNQA